MLSVYLRVDAISELPLDATGAMHLALKSSAVGPGRVHVLVTVVQLIHLLGLLILLVIEREHSLVRLLVDQRFSRGSTATPLGDLDDHLGLLVGAEVVGELLANLHLLVHDPQHGVVDGKIVAQIHLLIVLFLVLEDEPDRLPLAEAMETGIGHHHETAAEVNLLLKHLLGEISLDIDAALMDQLLHLHGHIKHLLGDVVTEHPTSAVLGLISDLLLTNGRRHSLEAISHSDVVALEVLIVGLLVETAETLRLERALRREILESDGSAINLESQVID